MSKPISNKKAGNDAEREFARLMFEKGYWVHIFADKVVGQPLDVVMSKDNMVWFVDVKNIQDKDYFLHSRIEENQHNAMKMLIKRGTTNVGFACKFNDGWYLLKYNSIDFTQKKTNKRYMIKQRGH